jgi:hypothetical protein
MQLEKKPSGARVEELRHAWVENENSRPVVDADDGAVAPPPPSRFVDCLCVGVLIHIPAED